jgi:pimeloyl-ACP methyl ester carboxylesterase
MPFVDVSGVKLYYEETGRGRPIIFVHEFAADSREWEGQVRHFSRSYRCIAYNARGYPPSDVPADLNQYGFEFAADDIAAVMRGVGVTSAYIVGLSMGGYAALQFGLRHPGIASAIVAAGAGSGSPPALRETWPLDSAENARNIIARGMSAMAEEMGQSPNRIQLSHKDPRGWRDFMAHLNDHSERGMSNTMARYVALRPSLFDFQDAFARMTTPVLLAVGDEDAPCIETNLMLKAALPNAGLWICPNTGHAINLEEPAAFNAQVGSFLSAVERGSWRQGE